MTFKAVKFTTLEEYKKELLNCSIKLQKKNF